MTDFEKEGPMTPEPTRPAQSDPWSVWFWRVVQVMGLLVFLEQVIVGGGKTPDRPWILLIAMAMMLGGFGMVTVIRAILRIGNGSS